MGASLNGCLRSGTEPLAKGLLRCPFQCEGKETGGESGVETQPQASDHGPLLRGPDQTKDTSCVTAPTARSRDHTRCPLRRRGPGFLTCGAGPERLQSVCGL